MNEQRRLTEFEFWQVWFEFHGRSRGVALLGWCALWAVSGQEPSIRALYEMMERAGAEHTTAWRAGRDLDRFNEALAKREGRPYTRTFPDAEVSEVLTRVKEVLASGIAIAQ